MIGLSVPLISKGQNPAFILSIHYSGIQSVSNRQAGYSGKILRLFSHLNSHLALGIYIDRDVRRRQFFRCSPQPSPERRRFLNPHNRTMLPRRDNLICKATRSENKNLPGQVFYHGNIISKYIGLNARR